MMAITHAAIAVSAASLTFGLGTNNPVALGLALLGSQLPDLDTTTSTIGQIKTINKGKISVPKYVWKVILVENSNSGEVKTIAVMMPNSEKVKRTDWTDYLVSVDEVENITGYDFFAYLSDDLEESIESKVYQ